MEDVSPQSNRKQEHFELLAEIAELLIEDDLDRIIESTGDPGNLTKDKYTIVRKNNEREEIARDELIGSLEGNMDVALTLFGPELWHHFEGHMKAENAEIESKGLKAMAAANPLQLVELLRMIAQRKTFKGNCPVCQDWQ